MFDFVRNNTRLMGLLLALFIVPAFVLVGVDGYRKFNGRGETVAVVAGQAIKHEQWDVAHKNEVDRIRASRPGVDAKMLDSDEARYATLERLVRERVLAAAAQKMNLITSDQRLARELQQNQAIAGLRKPDGSLDMDRYRQLLAAQGMSPEMFEGQMRQDISSQQVTQGVVTSGFATSAEAKASLNAFFQKRDVQFMRFEPAAFKAKVQVSDADVEQYYNAHTSAFQAQEEADIQYLVLDIPTVAQGVVISDADIKAYYDQNQNRYASPEERRARHILISADAKAPAAQRDAARAKATELLAQLRKDPQAFTALAKKESQDPGSAPQGGDLGFFQRGAMVKPFEDAAFALKKDEISAVVESDFGFHIIQVTDIKPSIQKPLLAVRAEIEADLKKQQAQREFAEKAEVFGNMVYEQSDALAPVAEKLKLKLQTANGVKRQPGPGMPPVLVNEKLLAALFSADSVAQKRNTEAVETGSSQLVSARIVAHRPAHTLALAEVKDRVREVLVLEKAQALAQAEGEKSLATWKSGAQAKLSPAVQVSRDKPQGLNAKELTAVLRADATSLPAWVGVEQGAAGYTVVRVDKVEDRQAPAAEQAKQELQQYSQWWSSAEGQAYYNALKKRMKVEIKVPRPAAFAPAVEG
jgi:peptidyl-prolyl cis-trans isomerase D